MPGEFAGKVAVITGGSRGIGREIAVDFAKAGAQTVIVSSSDANLAAATKTIAAAGGPAPLAITADLRKLEGVQQVFDTVKDKFGRCDILVNSAGATKAGNFVDLPDEAWMDGYALKLFGCVRMCRAVLADAEGGERLCRQHRRRRGALARRRFLDRRFGQRRDGQFLQGAVAARQEGRRQRQRHPSRRDRDRAVLSAARAALEGVRQVGRPAEAGGHRQGRPAPARQGRGYFRR